MFLGEVNEFVVKLTLHVDILRFSNITPISMYLMFVVYIVRIYFYNSSHQLICNQIVIRHYRASRFILLDCT